MQKSGNTTIELVEEHGMYKNQLEKVLQMECLWPAKVSEALPLRTLHRRTTIAFSGLSTGDCECWSGRRDLHQEMRGKNLFELTGIRDNEYLRIEKIENNTIYARRYQYECRISWNNKLF